jgi:uncharacterized protein (UPF0548 family)
VPGLARRGRGGLLGLLASNVVRANCRVGRGPCAVPGRIGHRAGRHGEAVCGHASGWHGLGGVGITVVAGQRRVIVGVGDQGWHVIGVVVRGCGEAAGVLDAGLVAAGRTADLFTEEAITQIHQAARGKPRTVNNICIAALIATAGAGKNLIDHACPATVRHDLAMGLCVLPTEVRDLLVNTELTYHAVGATAGDLPAGYHHLTRSLFLGHGHRVFTAAGDAVCQWRVQLGAGLKVSTSAPTVVAGAVVILGFGIGSARLQAPCRVVYTVDEPRCRGFAYGTLAGHPESGEEAFIIEHRDDDTVSFKIKAFSRPATRLAKIAGPLGAVVQRQITAAYLRSVSKWRCY